MKSNKYNTNRSSAILAGVLFILFGILLLAKTWGFTNMFPDWLISWPSILIVIGLVSGFKHRFSKPGAYYLIGIGTAFLVDKIYPAINTYQLLFPSILLAAGMYMIFGKHNHSCGFNKLKEETLT